MKHPKPARRAKPVTGMADAPPTCRWCGKEESRHHDRGGWSGPPATFCLSPREHPYLTKFTPVLTYEELLLLNKKLTERVTVDQEVTGVIRDLVLFVHYLRENNQGSRIEGLTDAELLRAARNYWDREHGE